MPEPYGIYEGTTYTTCSECGQTLCLLCGEHHEPNEAHNPAAVGASTPAPVEEAIRRRSSYGIYEGTIGEREYAHGRDHGRTMADALAEAKVQAWAGEESIGRDELDAARTERTRAYWLGWLRGFREVSR